MRKWIQSTAALPWIIATSVALLAVPATADASINVLLSTDKNAYAPGDVVRVTARAFYEDASPVTQVKEARYESKGAKGSFTNEGNGVFTCSFAIEEDAGYHSREFKAKITDANGVEKEQRTVISVSGDDDGGYRSLSVHCTLVTDKYSYERGETIQVTVEAFYGNGTPVVKTRKREIEIKDGNGVEVVKDALWMTGKGVFSYSCPIDNTAAPGAWRIRTKIEDAYRNRVEQEVRVAVEIDDDKMPALRIPVTTDKEAYLPGETIHFSALALRADGSPATDIEESIIDIRDPIDTTIMKTALTEAGDGLFTYALPLASSAMPGTWKISVKIWEKGGLEYRGAVKAEVLPGSGGNLPPTAYSQNVSTPQNTPVPIVLSAFDPNGDLLTYNVVAPPAHGTLTGTAPNLTYTPDPDYTGTDGFTFMASDGQANSNIATVSVSVNSVNQAPVAADGAVTTAEDSSVAIGLAANDPDGDPLVFTVVTPPAHGSIVGAAPNLTYAPDANFNGADSLQFKVNDGQADSNVATVAITVTPVNDAPLAQNQSVVTTENTAVAVSLAAVDPDGDALTYSVVSPPSNGTLSGAAPNLTYTPASGYNGPDAFTFKANDGQADSNVASVSIDVNAVNDPPVANGQTMNTTEDNAVAVVLSGADPDGDPLTFSVMASPAHGTLGGTPPNLMYTPDADYNGPDSFTFMCNDGQMDSNVATVSIAVSAVNDAPVAQDLSIATTEGSARKFVLPASDVDGDSLSYSIVSPPSHGTLSGTAPNLTYTPNSGSNGSDSFTFQASDGKAASNIATVSIEVSASNDAPVAQFQSVETSEDTPVAVVLQAIDPDGDSLTYSVAAGPTNGSLSGTAPNLTYTPDPNYNGSDSISFKANDGQVDSNVATVSINVTPVNDAPTASDQSVNTSEDTAVAVTLSGGDVDGDALTFSIVTPPSHGTLSGTAPNLNYTPATGYSGPDAFTFKANDGQADSNVATVSINVTAGGNHAPVADDQSLTTDDRTPLEITLTATDPDGDTLFYSIISWPAYGSLKGIPPNMTYTPNPGYNGTDSFTFKARDGLAESNIATVSITVTSANSAPIADDQSVKTEDNTPVEITLTATDPDGDALFYNIVTWPANGSLTGTPPNMTYTPNPDYSGPDSFTFKARDGLAESNIATVQITVVAVNYAPVADDQSMSTVENTPLAVTLTASDKDGDALTYSIVSGPANGSLSGTAPNLTYTPNAGFSGSDSFTFKANDGLADSNVATVSIAVTSSITHPWTTTWTGPGMCVSCHTSQANAVHASVHYQWLGDATYMTHGPAQQGKLTNAVNSYCINILGNWNDCGKCHMGRGAMPEPTATADQLDNIDCMLCHQKEYKRKKVDGVFVPDTDTMSISMDLAVQTIHQPVRANCLQCHANSGGGDAVKRGDLAMAHVDTTDSAFDFHMSTTGANMDCQECHTFTNHRVKGKGSDLRPSDSAELLDCIECHADKATATGHTTLAVNTHVARVACQSCHIRHYAKNAADTAATEATETHRTWTDTESTAAPYHPFSIKENDLIPQYKFWNRYSDNYLLYDTAAIDPETGFYPTSRPEGGIDDANSKLYPFKYKTAEQPITVGSRQLIALDTSVYFATGDGDAATRQGLVNMGLSADEPYEWVFTDTYQLLNHEVGTTSQVLQCVECHENKTQMNLPVNLGYGAKDEESTLCVQCHGLKPNKGFLPMHDRHVTRKHIECSWCHTFSRPERGLK